MQRPCVLLLLCSMPLSVDALSLYDPKLCFILDGFLGIYGLFITAMFIREKFFRSKAKSEEPLYTGLRGEDQAGHNEHGYRRRGREAQAAQDSVYTGLTTRGEDSEYKELPRREQRQRKKEQVYEGLSSATRDTYDSLHPSY
ncbi:T-cell surface glycoprotein CD3 zeta chain-like isoform X2 [Periophthalmus magnuspinnatus]|uniref:T-cell surface glycoprotein CD3 zeta chain-like isoform X2 n=1 Tax=Periophthalmus magnuspinnatus TaxID=409849 RepID=UPI002436FD36|nr:T-cell surface glycoprotein CD3 zeta chain-like isoform X2 [Periophthalmus magnuspinnatus]